MYCSANIRSELDMRKWELGRRMLCLKWRGVWRLKAVYCASMSSRYIRESYNNGERGADRAGHGYSHCHDPPAAAGAVDGFRCSLCYDQQVSLNSRLVSEILADRWTAVIRTSCILTGYNANLSYRLSSSSKNDSKSSTLIPQQVGPVPVLVPCPIHATHF